MKITSKEIDNLEAGAVMNALVAVEVMEWKQSQINPDNFLGETGVILGFKPSTEIASAWAVQAKFNYCHLFRWDEWVEDNSPVWECKLEHAEPKELPRKFYAKAPTAPLAISRAALKAVLNRDQGEG